MVSVRASAWGGVYHDLQMDDLVGTAVRVTAERHRADEWAIVRAAGSIPHRLRPRLDGWALIVAARDAEAAREALDAYDRENVADAPHVIGNAGGRRRRGNALTAAPVLLRPLRPSARWALIAAVLASVVGAWLRAIS